MSSLFLWRRSLDLVRVSAESVWVSARPCPVLKPPQDRADETFLFLLHFLLLLLITQVVVTFPLLCSPLVWGQSLRSSSSSLHRSLHLSWKRIYKEGKDEFVTLNAARESNTKQEVIVSIVTADVLNTDQVNSSDSTLFTVLQCWYTR